MCPASPARSRGLRVLWYHSIEAVQSLQSQQKGHCNSGHYGVGDVFQDRRQLGHQDAAASPSNPHQPPHSSQPVPPGELWMSVHFRTAPLGHRCYDRQLLADLRRASAMAIPRCIVSRCATAWTEGRERASSHQSWAVLCRYRCRLLLAEIPKGSDRNAGLKRRLQLLEAGDIHELVGRVLGQQHTEPFRRKKKVLQPQTDEQRGKRACASTARGSISKSVKGLVGGAGFSRLREELGPQP